MNRRDFIRSTTSATLASAALPRTALTDQTKSRGRADAAILIWLGGGPAQTDTFDPKRLGDPAKNIAGSAYPAIDTAVRDVQVCEHLPRVAERLDRMTILRTVTHDVNFSQPAWLLVLMRQSVQPTVLRPVPTKKSMWASSVVAVEPLGSWGHSRV